jgi:predicted AlkP superfamily pyrophosphatase or phosphodiesterase
VKTKHSSKLQVFVFVLLTLVLIASCQSPPPADDDFTKGTGGINAASQLSKPYLVLVSIDGFRWDYMDRYPTPNLDRIASKGSKAERLLPVFPTLTFPNHYSIATGLYPAHHGLVANDFPDPERNKWYSLKNRETVEDSAFYSGEPIWVTAETQGMVSASFFWVGTEAAVSGVSPTHWRSFDKNISGQERVEQVLSWMAEPEKSRPHLYTLYFENVDDYSHWKGPESQENIEAIKRVDEYVGQLLDGIEKLPYSEQVNIIVVSDHGQGSYLENPQPFVLGDHVKLEGTTVIEGGPYLFLHLDEDNPSRASKIVDTVNRLWKHGRAYLPVDTPKSWFVDDNPRFPDVILVAEQGFAVLSSAQMSHKLNAGDHGWPPESPAMHGFFIASGPSIKADVTLGPVNNIDVYPLMLSILGLEGPASIDGDASSLQEILISSKN